MACMGSCFAGPRATSQAFFNFSVPISSGVGIFLATLCDFLPARAFDDMKPGGSGILLAFFARAGGGLLSSTTHFGGGGISLEDMACERMWKKIDSLEIKQLLPLHLHKTWKEQSGTCGGLQTPTRLSLTISWRKAVNFESLGLHSSTRGSF